MSRGEVVGDRSGVVREVGWGLVDFVDQQGECAGQAGAAGRVESDGDLLRLVVEGAVELEEAAGQGAVLRPGERGVRHAGPPTVRLVNLREQATRTA